MAPEELKALGEKVANGSATSEEKLAFLRELNTAMEEMRHSLSQIKKEKE